MNVAIPPEFAAFAREQVATGAFASEQEAVAVALRSRLPRPEKRRALTGEGDNGGETLGGRGVFDRVRQAVGRVADRLPDQGRGDRGGRAGDDRRAAR